MTKSPVSFETSVVNVTQGYDNAQSYLMEAYDLTENRGDGSWESQVKSLAKKLGMDINGNQKISKATVEALQIVAKERFERASQVTTLFSQLMDRVAQMKERIIQNIGR